MKIRKVLSKVFTLLFVVVYTFVPPVLSINNLFAQVPPYTLKTFSDSSYSVEKSVFLQGNTVYARGTSVDKQNLELSIWDKNGTQKTSCSGNTKTIDCQYILPSDAQIGTWDVQLKAKSGGTWILKETVEFEIISSVLEKSSGETTIGMCMEDAYGSKLNCTANDVSIANVLNIDITDDGCTSPADTVTFKANWQVQSNASERYNIGLYFPSNGQNSALNGTCSVSTLSNFPTPPWYNFDNNACGDISSSAPVFPQIELTVKCLDTDGDNLLNLPYCTSWHQNISTCNSAADAIPLNASKCNCNTGFTVPITVPYSASVEVVKALNPSDDDGRFNLYIDKDETFEKSISNIGNGGSTGKITVGAGTSENSGDTHTVSETAYGDTNLSDYSTSIQCVDRGTSNVVASSQSAGPLTIDVEKGDDIVCTITNTRSLGTLIVNKVLVGTSEPTSNFGFSINQQTSVPFELDGSNSITVLPGIYSVVENNPGAGYSVSYNNCSDLNITNGVTETCTITNTKLPTLTVNKILYPAGHGAFNLLIDSVVKASGVDNGGTTGAQIVSIGKHTVSEQPSGPSTVMSEYIVQYGGDCNSSGEVTLAAGENKTCTITNTAYGSVSITKDIIPTDSTNWDFTLNGIGGNYSANDLVDNQSYLFSDLVPGAYDLTETSDSKYTTNIVCNDIAGVAGSNTYSLTVNPGQNISCTITNTRNTGRLLVQKLVDWGNVTDWSFSLNGGPAVQANARGVVDFGQVNTEEPHTIVEYGPFGTHYLGSVSGTNCTPDIRNMGATATVTTGGTTTCTFSNLVNRGSITIIKEAIPNDSQDFSFRAIGDGLSNFTLDDDTDPTLSDTRLFSNLLPGSYTISEPTITGWDLTSLICTSDIPGKVVGPFIGTSIASFALVAGEDVTCTFTNTKKGEIIVEKQVLPDGHAQTFPFSGEVSGTISDGQQLSKVVVPGTYNVSESPFSTSGFRLTSIVCEDNNSVGDITTGRVNFNVEPGETVKCTFTNEIFGSITGHKYHDLNQNGLQGIDEPDLSGWEMKIYSGSDCQEGSYLRKANTNSSGDITFYSIIPGDYSMEETLQTGWSNISNICQNFTVTPAEAEIVNFGNIQLGSITVIKTDNLDSGQDFTFNYTPTGSSTTQFILDDDNNTESTYSDSTTYSNLLPNFYNIDEVVPSGWTSSIVDCTSNYPGLDTFTQYENGVGTMHTALRAGENLVCTFENIRDTGTLQVLKNVDLNADGDFNDLGETGATDWLWQIDGGIDHNTGDPAITIPTGTYHLTETNQTNFHVTGLSCIGGVVDGSDVNITKDANVICTFTNVRDTGRVTFIKTVDQGPAQPSDWTFSVYNENDELLGDTYSSGNTYTIETGSYHVEESSVQGYSFDSATGICSFDAPDGSIVLTVSTNGGTCTISNLRDTGSILVHKFEDSNTNGEIDANEGGLEGWEMGIYAGFGCNGQVIQNGFQSTDNRGDAQFDNIVTGEYSVMETPQEDWITTTPLCQDINVNFGETTSVNVGNAKLSDIHGYKWNDFDEDGYLDTCDDRAFLRVSFDDEETIADTCTPEPLLSGWTINLYKWNGDEYSSEPIKSMDTDSGNEHFGWYWFEDLLPGQYKICEVPQSGWNQTYPINEVGNCHVVNLPDDNSYAFPVSLNYVAGPEYNFGNNIIPPQLQIEKTNDTGGLGMNTGDVVTYTITVKAPEDDIDGTYLLEDIILTDLLPEGFEYILGSWTGTASEPIYNGLPAKWNIGDMQEGDTKVLTYKAVISSTQQPGIYPDIAWVSGEDILGAKVLGISTQDPQENFVGTEVLVIAEEELEEGEVLGASTEVTLPSTGANTYLTLGAIISMIIGFLLLIVNPKKKIQTFVIVTTLLLGIGAFTKPTPTYAVAEKVEVKIGMPQSPTNKDSFNISFVALNLTGDPIEIKCYEETKGLFATYIAERGNCPVDDTIITTSGTYKFYVTAKTGSTTAQSSTVTVVVDLDMPTPITSYTKTQGPCSYILTFTTGNGSKVQIFRSTVQPFIANASTLIKELSVLPNQNVTYTDIVPVCDQEYFYAIRTVDTVGNPSVIVTDDIVKTVQAPPTTTTPATTVTTPGTTIPVTEDEEVAGEDISVDEEVLGEQQTVEDETPVTGEVSDDTENTEDKKNNTVIYIIAIVLLGSIGYIYVKNRKSTY